MNLRSILAPFADFVKDEPVLMATGVATFMAWLVSQFGLSVETTNLIRMAVVGLLAIVARYSVTPTSSETKTREDAVAAWIKQILDDIAAQEKADVAAFNDALIHLAEPPVAPKKPPTRRTRKASASK